MTKKQTEERWPEPVYLTADHAINMSLRDYFAAKAMPKLIGIEFRSPENGAQIAYKWADAMLKARGQT